MYSRSVDLNDIDYIDDNIRPLNKKYKNKSLIKI